MRRIPHLLRHSLQVVFFVGLLMVMASCFFVVNTTGSFPLGIYMKTYGPVHWGDIVLVCPEDNEVNRYGRDHGLISYGVCLHRYGYLIKRVVALGGDEVDISDRGVRPAWMAASSCMKRLWSCPNIPCLSTVAISAL